VYANALKDKRFLYFFKKKTLLQKLTEQSIQPSQGI
jgi:hypothetical protein